jgi:hypothetical protein
MEKINLFADRKNREEVVFLKDIKSVFILVVLVGAVDLWKGPLRR